MTRILVLQPHAFSEPAIAAPRPAFEPAIEATYRPVGGAWSAAGGFVDAALEDLAVFEAGRHAAEEGFDAVCVEALDDGGANALRSMLALPVLATGKTVALHALTLGGRFALIAGTRERAVRAAAAQRQWGIERHCAALRTAEPDAPHALRATLWECLDQGAEVLCFDSGALSTAARKIAPDFPLALLDPVEVTVRLAQALVAVSLTHSRTASPAPLVPKLAVIEAMARQAVSQATPWTRPSVPARD
jgi:allantoin racemase